jgi:hypothetical protein
MNRLKFYSRWAGVLPAAALAGWLVWLALQAFGRVTMWAINVDPAFGVGRAYVETLSGLIAGVLFLVVGVKLAPGHRRRVAYALAGMALLAGGFLGFPALLAGERWTAWNVACAAVAAGLAGIVAAQRQA